MSSTSASSSHSKWQCYGAVPPGRCPDCRRTAPLKRRVTTSDKNGNAGREYVKWESKPELGEDLLPCDHFEWLDVYIKRIENEGTSVGAAPSVVPNLPAVVEQLGSAAGVVSTNPVATVQNGVQTEGPQKDEFKKMNKLLEKLVDLKKQSNLMAAIFYLCAIALGVIYVQCNKLA